MFYYVNQFLYNTLWQPLFVWFSLHPSDEFYIRENINLEEIGIAIDNKNNAILLDIYSFLKDMRNCAVASGSTFRVWGSMTTP